MRVGVGGITQLTSAHSAAAEGPMKMKCGLDFSTQASTIRKAKR